MDLEYVLAELRKERDDIDAAIHTLERLHPAGSGDLRHSTGLTAQSLPLGGNGHNGKLPLIEE